MEGLHLEFQLHTHNPQYYASSLVPRPHPGVGTRLTDQYTDKELHVQDRVLQRGIYHRSVVYFLETEEDDLASVSGHIKQEANL